MCSVLRQNFGEREFSSRIFYRLPQGVPVPQSARFRRVSRYGPEIEPEIEPEIDEREEKKDGEL